MDNSNNNNNQLNNECTNQSVYPNPQLFIPFTLTRCQFCESPSGEISLNNLDEHGNWVYMACQNCNVKRWDATKYFKEKMEEKAKWNIIKSFVGKQIRVKRTSGIIEDTWYVRPDHKMGIDFNKEISVFVSTQKDNEYGKYIPVAQFFLLNNIV